MERKLLIYIYFQLTQKFYKIAKLLIFRAAKLKLHVKLNKAVDNQNLSNSQPHMSLKKHSFNDDEEPIFDEALIYKRGEYWQMLCGLLRKVITLASVLKQETKAQLLTKPAPL